MLNLHNELQFTLLIKNVKSKKNVLLYSKLQTLKP